MLTRGRLANHVYLEVVGDGDPHSVIRPDLIRPLTPTDHLEVILARDDTPTSATTSQREQSVPAVRLGEAAARYVLAGTTAAWQQVLTGAVPPLLAIMTGKLKLTKGALAELLPYVNAAKELVLTAASVPGVFGGRE